MTLWMNGAFNAGDPWMNVPLYIWGLVIWWFVILPVVWFGLKLLKWDKYVKFHGLHYAKKNDSSAVLIVDPEGNADMIAENKAKCVFDYSQDDYEVAVPDIPLNVIRIASVIVIVIGFALAYGGNWIFGAIFVLAGVVGYAIDRLLPWAVSTAFWYPTKYFPDIGWQQAFLYKIGSVNYDCKIAQILQGGEWDRYPVVNCAGIPVEIIYDSDGWCKKNSRQNLAIRKFCKQWNIDNPNDQIHTFSKFQRYHDEGKIHDEDVPEVKFQYIVPWVRIDSGFPYYPKSDYDGKLRQMAQREKKEKEEEGNRYILWIIAAGILLLVLEIAARLISKMIS